MLHQFLLMQTIQAWHNIEELLCPVWSQGFSSTQELLQEPFAFPTLRASFEIYIHRRNEMLTLGTATLRPQWFSSSSYWEPQVRGLEGNSSGQAWRRVLHHRTRGTTASTRNKNVPKVAGGNAERGWTRHLAPCSVVRGDRRDAYFTCQASDMEPWNGNQLAWGGEDGQEKHHQSC